MIGKIIGAFAGSKMAEKTSGISGPGGALLGMASVAVVRRLSIPALVVLGAGGYAYKKYSERRAGKDTLSPNAANDVSKPFGNAPTSDPKATAAA